jgi:hypothetical protein
MTRTGEMRICSFTRVVILSAIVWILYGMSVGKTLAGRNRRPGPKGSDGLFVNIT